MDRIVARRRSCFERIEPRLLFTTIYVDLNAVGGSHDGTSWDNAFPNIPAAITAAAAGDDVRVADGTYFPTAGADRTVSIQLKSDVVLTGGYLGSGAVAPDSRTGVTILSGDIGTSNDSSDNSYHVVAASGTSSATSLDGFTITSGNAFGTTAATRGGGGIYITAGSLAVSNCNFIANLAGPSGGGAIYGSGSSLNITGCEFTQNQVSNAGDGVGASGAVVDMGALEYVTQLIISSAVFDYDSAKPSVKFTFNGDVNPASLAASDLVLLDVTANQFVDCSTLAVVSYDAANRTAIWTFPALLADANYRVTLAAGVVGSALGTANINQLDRDFFALAGDANHDRAVNINDLMLLAMNWQGSGKVFSQGDFNYDGTIDATDLAILSARWQAALPEAPPPAAPASVVRAPVRRTPIRAFVL